MVRMQPSFEISGKATLLLADSVLKTENNSVSKRAGREMFKKNDIGAGWKDSLISGTLLCYRICKWIKQSWFRNPDRICFILQRTLPSRQNSKPTRSSQYHCRALDRKTRHKQCQFSTFLSIPTEEMISHAVQNQGRRCRENTQRYFFLYWNIRRSSQISHNTYRRW